MVKKINQYKFLKYKVYIIPNVSVGVCEKIKARCDMEN